MIVSSGDDKTVQIWDATSGKRLLTYTEADITTSLIGTKSISWSPDRSHIVCSADKTVLIWDAQTGKTLFSYGPLWQLFIGLTFTVAWSPDGTRIASGAGNAVRVWRP